MSTRRDKDATKVQADALGRVLDAEKKAALQIEAARSEATQIITAAKQSARAEAERTDRRVQSLHKCAGKALEAKQVEISTAFEREARARAAGLSDAEIDALVARLARRLTGQSGE